MPVTAIIVSPTPSKVLWGLWQKDEESEAQKCLSNGLKFTHGVGGDIRNVY